MRLLYLVIFLSSPIHLGATPSGTGAARAAVTYNFSGGRLGDNLVAYLHAKWISYKYGIPLLYKPFPHSDELMLSEEEQPYSNRIAQKFTSIVELKPNTFLSFDRTAKTLYVINYFPESLEEHRVADYGSNGQNGGQRTAEWPYFLVQWEDQRFLEIIRKLIKPKKPLNLITPPKDCISVAVHVRKNSGNYDFPLLNDSTDFNPQQIYSDLAFPLKCVPESFYLEQIYRIISMFKGQRLYCYIFTDDPNPALIADRFEERFAHENIIFDYRRSANNHYSNVLEDLFSMGHFDCLIRNDSNLSIVASKLADFNVLITPMHHHWEGKKLIIDKIAIQVKNHAGI